MSPLYATQTTKRQKPYDTIRRDLYRVYIERHVYGTVGECCSCPRNWQADISDPETHLFPPNKPLYLNQEIYFISFLDRGVEVKFL